MVSVRWRNIRLSQLILPVCLLAQACLLLPRLDLLPVWGDEHFTLRTASGSIEQVLRTIADEQNNPPAHTILVRVWLAITDPLNDVLAARALSVLFALASTIVIDRLWLKPFGNRARLWCLLLWTLSPSLLLYARMARSYSLQVLVFAVAFRIAIDLVRRPRLVWTGLAFAVAATCLLYVHYLPGLALLGSTILLLSWNAVRRRKPVLLGTALELAGIVGLLYLPWLSHLWVALGRMVRGETPSPLAGGLLMEGVRLCYLAFSFAMGETPPTPVLIAAVTVAPMLLYVVWKGAKTRPDWLPALSLMTVAAYVGAGHWVSFVFIPGRLLFLLPFFLLLAALGIERTGRLGIAAGSAMLCLTILSAASYYRQTDFLNKAYLIPYQEIAQIIVEGSMGRSAMLVADTWNADPAPLTELIPSRIERIAVSRSDTENQLKDALGRKSADLIWYFRNTHDTSPGGLNMRLEDHLRIGRRVRQYLFVPYSRRDMLLMRLLGWPTTPTHLVQLLELRRIE